MTFTTRPARITNPPARPGVADLHRHIIAQVPRRTADRSGSAAARSACYRGRLVSASAPCTGARFATICRQVLSADQMPASMSAGGSSALRAALSQWAWRGAGTQLAMAPELLPPMKAHPAPVAPLCQAPDPAPAGLSIQPQPTYPFPMAARGVRASAAATGNGESPGRAATHANRSRSSTVARNPPAGTNAPRSQALPGTASTDAGRSPLLVMPRGVSTRSRASSQYGSAAAVASACPRSAAPRLLYAAFPGLAGRTRRVSRIRRRSDVPR